MDVSDQHHALATSSSGNNPTTRSIKGSASHGAWLDVSENRQISCLARLEPRTIPPVVQSLYRYIKR